MATSSPPPPPSPEHTGPPLTLETLLQVLHAAQNPDPSQRHPAEQLLQSWEPLHNFPTALHAIVRDVNVDENVRQLAAICLKNCVIRWWKRRPSGGVGDEDKMRLRTALLSGMEVLSNQIARIEALAVAKIARNDWPQQYSELFPTLLGVISGGEGIARKRALFVMHVVVKELSAVVVGPTRKHFQEATPPMFNFLCGLWQSASQQALLNPEAAEVELLCLKILLRLVCFGFNRIDLVEDVAGLLGQTMQMLQTRFEQALQPGGGGVNAVAVKSMAKVMVMVSKAQHANATANSLAFAPFIVPYLNTALSLMQLYPRLGSTNTPTPLKEGLEAVITHAILFLTNVLSCTHYHGSRKSSSPPSHSAAPLPSPEEVQQRVESVLTPQVCSDLTSLLISSFLTMSPSALQDCAADPEAFASEENNEEGLRVRQTAETLLMTLLGEKKEAVTTVIVHMLNSNAQTLDPAPEAVLLRDALYNAVGLCCYELETLIPFTDWFSTTLLQELSLAHKLQWVLKRRVAMLLGAWVDSFKDPQPRDAAYNVLLTLMGDDNMAVRIAACDGLLSLVDDVNFYSENFQTHLVKAMTLLFELIAAAREVDTKLRVLNTITILMAGMGERIQPVVQGILQAVPALWEEAKQEHLLKGAVLVTITRLVQAVGADVASIEGFITGVIQFSADVTAEHELYTLVDGLDLLLATLRNIGAATPGLLQVFPNVVAVVQRDFENMQACMHITESYLLLAPAEMFALHCAPLAMLFTTILGNVKDAGTLIALEVLETMVTVRPVEGRELLEQSGILLKILSMAVSGEEGSLVTASILSLFSRICAYDAPAFLAILLRLSPSIAPPPSLQDAPSLLCVFIDLCVDKVDQLMLPGKRRTVAMALASLLATQDLPVLHRATGIVNVIVEVLHQENKDALLPAQAEAAAQGFGDLLSRETGQFDCTVLEPQEQELQTVRRRQLEEADPLQQALLPPFVRERLQQCAALNGQPLYDQMMGSVDPDILAQLNRFCPAS